MIDGSAIFSAVAVIMSAGIAGVGAIYSTNQSRKVSTKQTEVEETKVDAEAYERAQSINQQIVEGLQTEIKRLNDLLIADRVERNSQIATLAAGQKETRDSLVLEQIENRKLKTDVSSLRDTVRRLRALVIQNGITLPPDLQHTHHD